MCRKFKRLIIPVIVLFVLLLFTTQVNAFSANEYGLGLSTAVTQTDSGIDVEIRLKNSNSFDVDGVVLNVTPPDELKMSVRGTLSAETLSAGDTLSATLHLSPTALNANGAMRSAPEKQQSALGKALAVGAAVAVLAAVIIMLALRRKRAAAMLMCVLLLMPVLSVFSVHAVGVDEARSFSAQGEVELGGKAYSLGISVDYTAKTNKGNYFELESDFGHEDKTALTDAIIGVSGSVVANGSVESVEYSINSEVDGYETGAAGEASLTGCDWSAQKLALKPGDNEVVITATLSDGSTQTDKINLTYDRGEVYRHTVDEVKSAHGVKYVTEMVNVYFNDDASQERIAEIIGDMDAEQVGEIYSMGLIQVRVSAASLDELETICKKFEEYPEVTAASIEQVVDLVSDATTNDPWYYNTSNRHPQDESLPAGFNWHIEAVQALSAWDYNSYYNNVKIGVVDGGFKTDHEDYDDLIHFPNSLYADDNDVMNNHGTHVAGIIGAKANNNKGIAGLLWDTDIYGINYVKNGTITYIIASVAAEIECGARAVNLSVGLSNAYDENTNPNPYTNEFSQAILDSMGKQCAASINNLLQNYEFVIVQSAGNGVVDSRLSTTTYRSADAVQNGLYCSVQKKAYGTLTLAQVTQAYNRIIVVGAVQNTSSEQRGPDFTMWVQSNGGSRVDIYAPGEKVMSTVVTNTEVGEDYCYGRLTGTSQAAPIVTAVAGLCFAINPNFTGEQVKNIVCSSDNTCYAAFDNDQTYNGPVNDPDADRDLHPFTGDGRVVNMKLCAEAALRTVCGRANYSFLNSILAAAQQLNPNDYTNYSVIQSVIDSIDNNLYEFEQAKVTAKAMELLGAMDSLQERGKASYAQVDSAIAAAQACNPNDYVDFSPVTAAVGAVVRGKYADEQAEVNAMAQAILDAITALVPKAQIETYTGDIVVDNTNRFVVLTREYADTLGDNLIVGGGCEMTRQTNGSGTYSTGSTVTLSRYGYGDVVYTVAVVGDINGDGEVDGFDAFLVNMVVCGRLAAPQGVYRIAGDADCSGELDENDALLIANTALNNDIILNMYTAE